MGLHSLLRSLQIPLEPAHCVGFHRVRCDRDEDSVIALRALEIAQIKTNLVRFDPGNAPVDSRAPLVPAEHSARLIALGYMVDLAGRLRMTTPGHPDICWATRRLRWPERFQYDF